ncbi:hypothetical protein BgAZ_502300 [Babesia gibsoni]|uniref:Uncharacterized protein n=1 Tax=Babesia gibsoni TaxID=33632 RepID=A0AAD8LI88_BABGI|nr:hypothetical protein BgAZ_502300 [Babesia gibsoni]
MSSPESVLAMHKSYFCLYYLNDFKRAISIAMDHFNHYDDGDLLLMVIMDITSRYMSRNGRNSVEDVQKVCLDLLKSKNLFGIQRIIVREKYESLEAGFTHRSKIRRLLIEDCKGRKYSRQSRSVKAMVGVKRNLSLDRIKITIQALRCINARYYERTKPFSICLSPKKVEPKRRTNDNITQHLKRNLIECYGNKNIAYFYAEDLADVRNKYRRTYDRNTESTGVSVRSPSPLSLCGRESMIHDTYSTLRFSERPYPISDAEDECLRRLTGDICLDDHASNVMKWWRKHFRLMKVKIFQVCNMLFININVPFIAIELFSRLFQNLITATARGVRHFLGCIFNQDDYPVIVEEDINGNRVLTEDDCTILFMFAAGCLEIALNYHNARARFDIFSLFYFLVFIDSILSSTDVSWCTSKITPSFLSIVDSRVVIHQKINCGKNYLRRSLTYHHNLFKRKLHHLFSELKKNRILHMANYQLMNCLEDVILLSHGIFGFNLTLRIAPVIIETSSCNVAKRTRYECNGHREGYNKLHMKHETPSLSKKRRCATLHEQRLKVECEDLHSSDYYLHKKVEPSIKTGSVAAESFSQSANSSEESLGIATIIEGLSTAPATELEKVNVFLTESTEVSILLLQMLSCSDYIEILTGNKLFTRSSSNQDSSALMSAMSLKFILDMFITITDESIGKMLSGISRYDANHLNKGAHCDYMEAFNEYFGDHKSVIEESNCAFYFIILEIDWIFHREGIYSDEEYKKHQRLLSSVIDGNSPNEGMLYEVFDRHHHLYEKIAILMFSKDGMYRQTDECVEAFRSREVTWNQFDEILIRNIRPEDELPINKDIMDIYYPDVGQVVTSFNPYKSIFTPKYFEVTKELVYRVKVALALYYLSECV